MIFQYPLKVGLCLTPCRQSNEQPQRAKRHKKGKRLQQQLEHVVTVKIGARMK